MNPTDPHTIAATYGLGSLDTVTATHISGWLWSPDAPDESLVVEILDGDQPLALVKAELYRPDLQALGMGNGLHGFAFNFAASILPFARHTLRARNAATGLDLNGSPRVLVREGIGLDRAGREFVEGLFASECALARKQTDLHFALAFAVEQLGTLLRRREALEAQPPEDQVGELAGLMDSVAPAQWVAAAGRSMSSRYAPLSLPVFGPEPPRVSIIIPVYGKFGLTHDCISSITQHLPEASFEVIVVDDCSKDETLLAPLVFGGTVRVVRNEANLGFVGSCNRGAELARGEFLFFLNNDTLVKPGWLDALVNTFEQTENVGIAGSKLIFADGSLQEAGGIIWRMGDGWNWGRNAHADDPRFNYLRDADYVSGAALMLPAALFRELGGFDTHFAPAYYEDTDLCFRVRQAGKRVVVQPQSVIVHLEGQTAGTSVAGSGMKRFQAVNHRKFYDRWKATLASHRFNAQLPELECERGVSKRAVFIDETVPTPDQDAGSNAALQHMKSLMRLGYKVTFIPSDNMARLSPYTEALQNLGIECIYHPFYWSVEEYFRKISPNAPVNLVYLHRFNNGTKYIGLVRRHQPKARILYNVADLHYLRTEREAALTESPELAQRAAAIRHEELAAIEAADATVVHSSVEKALLAQDAPKAKVHVVPWAYPLRPVKTPAEARRGVVFVGGYRHTPNVDAALWLVQEIMPLVWKELPGLPCTLVGSHMPESVQALGKTPHVAALGYVPDVQDVYERCLVAVAPLRYGAGVKGKVLEAFAAGLPCIMTPVAAEGLELPEAMHGLVCDDAAAVAKAVVRAHTVLRETQALAEASLSYMESAYSSRRTDTELNAIVSRD